MKLLKQRLTKVGVILLAAVMMFSIIPAFDCGTAQASTKVPKYVFYFIGDGLGASQRQVSEFYLQEVTGDKDAKLVLNELIPVVGMNTTYSADSLVTDSAAAGTALATGNKTNNKMISVLPDGKTEPRTLIEEAEANGMATGLVTTTRLTHATPATFAAHNVSRYNANEIAEDYLESGVDFFAGGGYRYFVPQDWKWGKSKREDNRNLIQEFYNKGYKSFVGDKTGAEAFRAFQPTGNDQVFAAFTYSHMPYEIDRVNSGSKVPSISEMTEKAIQSLEGDKDGFFIMVEGGRIDHACHANDPAGTIHDTLAFDKAVEKAYKFYQEHPEETLILVVGDHETGGMGLGFGQNYFLKMDQLNDVKISVEDTLQGKYTGDRAAYYSYIANKMGLSNLTENEKTEIEAAMNMVDGEIDPGNTYGGYDPVAIAVTHVSSERVNLEWTTYAHSGTAIPYSALGVGADNFTGYKDNTDISQIMGELMGFKLTIY